MTYSSNYYGSIIKTECPVCESQNIRKEWKIPMTSVDPPERLLGGYYNQIPLLKTPFTVFGFDYCQDCESIFLNPDIPRANLVDIYRKSTSYVKAMENANEWHEYKERYDMIMQYLPSPCEAIIDAASGFGQIALLAKQDKHIAWKRIAALELSQTYVEQMRRSGIEAYEFDIDQHAIADHFTEGCIDFIVFFEAFEHVASPTHALRKLLWTLRNGGRIFFTAQRYGDDVDLPIRPGEPIYIGDKYIDSLEQRLGCKLVDVQRSGSRYFVVIEKDASPGHVRLGMLFNRDEGNCWVADLGKSGHEKIAYLQKRSDIDAAPSQSPLRLYERSGNTMRELGPAHSVHSAIRTEGGGRFSHWKGSLYFSSSDNTDPNKNGRSYFISD